MQIELKNVKYAAFASQETNCYTATIYVDGVKAGDARNDGHGGMTMIHPGALMDKLNAYAATLPAEVTEYPDPQDPSKKMTIQPSGDSLIDDLLEQWLIERDVTKALKKRILFTKAGTPGVYETPAVKSDEQMRVWLADPMLTAKLKSDKILNLLPLAEAVAIYRAAAR